MKNSTALMRGSVILPFSSWPSTASCVAASRSQKFLPCCVWAHGVGVGDCHSIKFAGRLRLLVAQCVVSIRMERTAHIPQLAMAIGGCHLPVDEFGDVQIKPARTILIGWNQSLDRGVNERPFSGIEIGRLVWRCLRLGGLGTCRFTAGEVSAASEKSRRRHGRQWRDEENYGAFARYYLGSLSYSDTCRSECDMSDWI